MIDFVRATAKATEGPILRAFAELPSRPWFLAPPLRVVREPRAEVPTLYTIQTREAYEALVNDGVLVGDSSRGWEEFQEAYGWMLRQMERRLPGPRDGLLWLWPTATRQQLRDSARHARGDVLLTVKVPRERVLLSEFSDWHAVLNRSLQVPQRLAETDEGWQARWTKLDDAFDARAKPYRALPISEWPDDLRAEIEASWEAIFDPATWRPKPDLQATMRQLHPVDVVRAVRIR